MFYVQIEEPKSWSSTTRAFIFVAKFAEFHYHKIFETKSVDVDLSTCMMDERSPCGSTLLPPYNWRCKDLSMPCDQKVMKLLPPTEKGPMNFHQGVVFCPNLINIYIFMTIF